MKIVVHKDHEAMSRSFAACFLAELGSGEVRHIALPGGGTPERMYDMIGPFVKDNPLYRNVMYYNLDELGGDGVMTNMPLLNRLFYTPNNIPSEQITVLDYDNYQQFDALLSWAGGLDAAFLGVGTDGHIAGIIPGTSFELGTHKAVNTPLFRKLVAGSFGGEDKVPEHVVTAGPRTVMQSKKLIVTVTGAGKAEVIAAALEGPVTPEVPASLVQLHPNVLVLLDEAAASGLKELQP